MTSMPGALWPFMLPNARQGRDTLCAVSASGVTISFVDGSTRLDGSSGLWNVNLGFGNEAIAESIAAALRDASYLGAWSYENVYSRKAARALVDLAGPDHYARVLFSTSGGAANEVGMKLARHYHALLGDPERKIVLGLRDGYHGLTFGAFALTDARLGHRLYGVDRRLVGHVSANDAGRLNEALDRLRGRVSAIVVEPVLGTGAVPLEDGYIAELLRLRREHGFLLVADEITTGFGRIGRRVFESQGWAEQPDLLITSKALTNGALAASAVIVARNVAQVFGEHDSVLGHAETQAGTAVVGAAILATIAEFERLDALGNSGLLSKHLDELLVGLADSNARVADTSGRGCLRAITLTRPDGLPLGAPEIDRVVTVIRENGALVHPGPSCVQLVPALVYTEDLLHELLRRVESGLKDYWRSR